ncbi:MAG: hypothetical protein V3V95_04000 [Thermodesulfobacteriota bacterium]
MVKILIKVETYSGYKADERPTSFIIRERVLKVKECLDQWYGEGYAYFKVGADDGYTYIIRHEMNDDQWELVKMEKEE